jgi:hypothetical protein
MPLTATVEPSIEIDVPLIVIDVPASIVIDAALDRESPAAFWEIDEVSVVVIFSAPLLSSSSVSSPFSEIARLAESPILWSLWRA